MKFDDETCTSIYKIMRGLMIGLAILCLISYVCLDIIFPNQFFRKDFSIEGLLILGISMLSFVYEFNNKLKANKETMSWDKLIYFLNINLLILFIAFTFIAFIEGDIKFAIPGFCLCVVIVADLSNRKTKK